MHSNVCSSLTSLKSIIFSKQQLTMDLFIAIKFVLLHSWSQLAQALKTIPNPKKRRDAQNTRNSSNGSTHHFATEKRATSARMVCFSLRNLLRNIYRYYQQQFAQNSYQFLNLASFSFRFLVFKTNYNSTVIISKKQRCKVAFLDFSKIVTYVKQWLLIVKEKLNETKSVIIKLHQ